MIKFISTISAAFCALMLMSPSSVDALTIHNKAKVGGKGIDVVCGIKRDISLPETHMLTIPYGRTERIDLQYIFNDYKHAFDTLKEGETEPHIMLEERHMIDSDLVLICYPMTLKHHKMRLSPHSAGMVTLITVRQHFMKALYNENHHFTLVTSDVQKLTSKKSGSHYRIHLAFKD
jgi:hypothetical protein